MTTEQRKELTEKIGGAPLKILAWIQILAILLLMISTLVCIWHEGSLGWKLGFTALFIAIIAGFISAVIEKIISKEIDKIEQLTKSSNEQPATKSRFQIKLEQMAKEKGISI